jgi:hypothetical protein
MPCATLDGTASRAEGGNGDARIDRDLIRAGLDGDADGLGGSPSAQARGTAARHRTCAIGETMRSQHMALQVHLELQVHQWPCPEGPSGDDRCRHLTAGSAHIWPYKRSRPGPVTGDQALDLQLPS